MRTLPLLILSALPLLAADRILTEQGWVSGTAGNSAGVTVYRGLPYAAPPVGRLRWAPPQPAAPWQGVRAAAEFGFTCLQPPRAPGSVYYTPPKPMSEDCLFLNVWTAAKAPGEKRPVMVWIHGGSLTHGSGDAGTYDGGNFARKGIVAVTINYRLGIFGFFTHPELSRESPNHASGNYAVLDQIAALKWVKKNIAAFGGDPDNVTIFGESAGSWSVNYLAASPLAKGLFHRAIGESGGAFQPTRTLADSETRGVRAGASLAELRNKPAEEVLKISWNTAPVVDGWTLPRDIHAIFSRGEQNDIPLIAGSNSDETTTLFPWPKDGTAETFVAQVRSTYGDLADEFLTIYPARNDAEAKAAHSNSLRDQWYTWQMRTWVRLQTQTGKSRAWLYQFSRIPPGPLSAVQKAYHASEIPYVFGNLNPPRPWEPTDRTVSELMNSYWASFAATGDPNGKGLPVWPAYSEREDQSIMFGDKPSITTGLSKPGLDFFDRYYAKLRSR